MVSIKYNVIIYNIHTFSNLIHNGIYELNSNYNILFQIKIIIWIIQKIDLNELP